MVALGSSLVGKHDSTDAVIYMVRALVKLEIVHDSGWIWAGSSSSNVFMRFLRDNNRYEF